MSSQEKTNAISLVTTFLVSIPYFIFIYSKYQNQSFTTTEELGFWATAVLLLIPLRIVSEIIIHILVAILVTIVTQKEEKSITDERDQLIELKGTRNSYFLFALGIVLSMISLSIYKTPASMFVVLLCMGFLSEVFGQISQMYYYNKGV